MNKYKYGMLEHNNDNSSVNSLTLHHGDCVKLLSLIPTASVSLVMYDGPYSTTALKWDKHLDYKALIAEFERVLAPLGTVVAFGSDQFTFHLFNAFAQHGLDLKYRYSAIWKKNRATGFLHAVNRPLKAHEDILVFSKGLMGHIGTGPGKTLKRMTYNPQNLVEIEPVESGAKPRHANCDYLGREPANSGGKRGDIMNGGTASKRAERRRGDTHLRGRKQEDGSVILWGKPRQQTHTGYTKTIFEYERESVRADPHRHPTKKPLALYKELIATYSNPGETILDPTMGSGTAGAAILELGDRSFLGIEADESYFAICEDRLGVSRKAVA